MWSSHSWSAFKLSVRTNNDVEGWRTTSSTTAAAEESWTFISWRRCCTKKHNSSAYRLRWCAMPSFIAISARCMQPSGGGEVRGASLRGGKMRGTVRGINARCWVICEAGMCEVQRTTGAAGVVVACEPLKRN